MAAQYTNIGKVISLLGDIGCSQFVVSPGSRNAPIVEAVSSSLATVVSHIDERCAGYVGLGIAKKSDLPVGLICTSGTAGLNYTPAIAEAYYQGVFLVAITADRPIGAVNSFESQTINQHGIFKNFVAAEVSISMNKEWTQQSEESICSALQKGIRANLPVHINLHLSEPLYDFEPLVEEAKTSPLARVDQAQKTSNYKEINIGAYKSPLVFLGFDRKKQKVGHGEKHFPLLTDACSHSFLEGNIFYYDFFLAKLSEEDGRLLQPDLLVTNGTYMLSKNLRNWLKKYPPKYHIHIDDNSNFISLFTTNFKVIRDEPKNVLSQLTASVNYLDCWLTLEKKSESAIKTKRANFSSSVFGILECLLGQIDTHYLHCGNSMSVRYGALFQVMNRQFKTVICNRGTSGIDGCVSTFLGYISSSNKKECLLVGDVSFFYDSNALWMNRLPEEFLIIVINNGGGEIFEVINGPEKMNSGKEFITTPHQVSVEYICNMHQISYVSLSSVSQTQEIDLFANKRQIIEIFEGNKHLASDYKNLYG